MNSELIWVLSLLAIAVVLFATGKVRMDAVALLVIIAFVLSGTLTLSEAFSGFSDPNVILIAALFIIGDGDCADIQLLMQHLRHFHAVFLVKTLAQNPFGRGRHF